VVVLSGSSSVKRTVEPAANKTLANHEQSQPVQRGTAVAIARKRRGDCACLSVALALTTAECGGHASLTLSTTRRPSVPRVRGVSGDGAAGKASLVSKKNSATNLPFFGAAHEY
jgi:hypothetical protein